MLGFVDVSFCGGVCALGCNVYHCLQSDVAVPIMMSAPSHAWKCEEDGLCLVQGNVKHEVTLVSRAFWILDDAI